QHRWDDRLPATAMFFPGDYPKPGQTLPRALPEQVMAQLEGPAGLSRWDNPACQLITVILIHCGLRPGDARRLARDCIARDPGGAPYLRYWNHKMKREALVQTDEELEQLIGRQQQAVRQRWPAGTPVLFPQPTATLTGARRSATAPTEAPWTAGWSAATSAANAAARSRSPRTSGGTRREPG